MINPLKVLLFLAGGTTVVAAGAYVSGVLDPLFMDKPQAVADLPAEPSPADETRPLDPGAPKEDRVEQTPGEAAVATEQPAAQPAPVPDTVQPPVAAPPASEQPGDQPSTAAHASLQPPTQEQPQAAAPPAEAPPSTGASQPASPEHSDSASAQPEEAGSTQEHKPADVAALDPQAPVAQPAPQPAVPAVDTTLPTFDVVRVETDGSMVIAGKAAPNAKVELMAGGKVIGDATSGPDGDFVVVLDDPLAPGDYQITIHAKTADTVTAESAQTAIVSIPANAGGQVLAMIEEPGKPSEIITVPQPTGLAAGEIPEETTPSQVAAAEPGAPADQPSTAAPAQAPPASGAVTPADGAAAADPVGPAETAAGTETESPADADTAEGGAQPSAEGTDVAIAAPDAGQSAADTAEGGAQPPAEGTDVAIATPDADQSAADTPSPPAIDVAVEAVEIDGSQVFVAGRAPAGLVVRVYANEILLGDAVTSPAGRFLVEAVQDLPVGDYVVRVDVLGANGAEVIARAAVPFAREPGENIAAIAPPAGAAPAGQKPVETSAAAPDADAPAGQPVISAEPAAPVTEQGSGEDQIAGSLAEEPAGDADGQTAAATTVAEAPGGDGQSVPSADAGTQTPAATEPAPPAAAGSTLSAEQPPAAPATSEKPAGEPQPPMMAEAPAAEQLPPAAEQRPAATEQPAAATATSEKPAGEPQPPVMAEAPPVASDAQPKPADGFDTAVAGEPEPPAIGGDMKPAETADAGEAEAPAASTVESPEAETESGSPAEIAAGAALPAGEAQVPVTGEAVPPAPTAETAAREPAPPASSAASTTPAAADPSAGDSPAMAAAPPPPEVTAPPLQKVDGAVIIRRGDTLWRISRRVYGRGVRYSTIYLANQDQIRDPDMIWPGQVFSVPDKTSEGEAADMSKMGEQVVPNLQ